MNALSVGPWEIIVSGLFVVGVITSWLKVLKPVFVSVLAIHQLIDAQLRPNGGSSLVDIVLDTQRRTSRIERHLGIGDPE